MIVQTDGASNEAAMIPQEAEPLPWDKPTLITVSPDEHDGQQRELLATTRPSDDSSTTQERRLSKLQMLLNSGKDAILQSANQIDTKEQLVPFVKATTTAQRVVLTSGHAELLPSSKDSYNLPAGEVIQVLVFYTSCLWH